MTGIILVKALRSIPVFLLLNIEKGFPDKEHEKIT